LETVAAIDAVPPTSMVVGGTVARETETAAGVVVFEVVEPEPTAPHPEKLIAKSMRTIFARSAVFRFFLFKYTGFSIIRIYLMLELVRYRLETPGSSIKMMPTMAPDNRGNA
jgi:hypothetical protein